MTLWHHLKDEIVIFASRAMRGPALVLLALLGLVGCDLGTDPLDPASVTISFSLPVGAELVGQVERVHVRISAAGATSPLLDTTFVSSGAAGPFTLDVPVENRVEDVTALIELFAASGLLFSGQTTASLETGALASIAISASPVPAAVILQQDLPPFTAIADTIAVESFVTMVTGDTIVGLTPELTTGDPTVALVVGENRIMSTGEGQTTLTASFEDKSATSALSVAAIVVGVSLEPEVLNVPLGTSAAFQATALDANGNSLERTATWSSDNTDVATVNDSGQVTPLNLGQAGVMVEIEGFPALGARPKRLASRRSR